MGRIKTQLIKRTTEAIMDKHGADFTIDFVQNKRIIDSRMSVHSKKIRNVIAGYATRLKKREG